MNKKDFRPLCIYHANCADGFTSAWVVNKYFKGNVDFYPGVHQKDPPDVTGRHVIFVDFSYKRDVIKKMDQVAKSILILDHHKSAMEELACFVPAYNSWTDHILDIFQGFDGGHDPRIPRVKFDLERSGAGITWDF